MKLRPRQAGRVTLQQSVLLGVGVTVYTGRILARKYVCRAGGVSDMAACSFVCVKHKYDTYDTMDFDTCVCAPSGWR